MRQSSLWGLAAVGVVSISIAISAAASDKKSNTEQDQAAAQGVPYTAFNLNIAHGLQRGCNACHGDHLAADVSSLPVPRGKPELHGIFTTSYGIPMRVEDCLPCHGNSFAGNIHSLHLHSSSFTALGGACDSCHAMEDGKFVLYDDENRYKVLNGVNRSVPTPPFSKP